MKIAIVDDEPKELRNLSETINCQLSSMGYPSVTSDAFSNAEDFFVYWKKGAYELIVLDIYMEGMSGIDAARKIRETDGDVFIVFCTESNEFASESYEVNAHYYLRKPFTEKNISDMLYRLDFKSRESRRFIELPDGRQLVLRNVIYTEYYNHVVTVHNKYGGDTRVRISQTSFEQLLCGYTYFFRICKGIVVNFYEVINYSKNIFVMSDGSTVSVSRRREKEVRDAYTDFCFERIRREMQE